MKNESSSREINCKSPWVCGLKARGAWRRRPVRSPPYVLADDKSGTKLPVVGFRRSIQYEVISRLGETLA